MNTQISSLIEDQLPGFITAEYENFTKVLEGYYEQLESAGQPLDIIANITNYRDVDYYEKHLLKERSTLVAAISDTVNQVILQDGTSFPERNGYIKIDDEILFYKERDGNTLTEVSRGVSGNTKLGDLYTDDVYSSSVAVEHSAGVNVDNLSHLFLYALTKAFEKEYLDSFPEAYLKDDVDKRTLIKNIGSFYKVKGNDKSIRFIFNTLISKSADDVPTTYNPKDNTLKVSTSDWDSTYALQAVVLSGDVNWLLGEEIIQQADKNLPNLPYASAVVENVVQIGTGLFNLIISPSSMNGEFVIPQQTTLDKVVSATNNQGDLITVDSTFGWKDNEGTIVINGEKIRYSSKSARQFTIEERGTITQAHGVGDKVYNYSTALAETPNGFVSLLIYGILTRLDIDKVEPYSRAGDRVQVTNSGFESRDPVLYDESAQNYRWKVNVNAVSPAVPLNPVIATGLSEYIADVSSLYEDKQYYYIATSSYPSTDILPANVSDTLTDPQLLKMIPKTVTTTTEVYSTPRSDVGVFVDGTIAYNVKDDELISFGPVTSFSITKRGSGYQKPPFVLLNGISGKARAILTGDFITSVESISQDSYTAPPIVEIVSGRGADLQAVVTSGSVSSIRIINAGEYYSSPPAIIITDNNGKGRFAQYNAVISTEGKIIDVVKVDGGKFYTQENIKVVVIPDALYSGATATSTIYEWVKNRFYDNTQNLDDNGGLVVSNNLDEKFYGVVGNPKRLRYRLGDNLTATTLEETQTLVHSPILGFAYDGHPIYGPYGHQDPLDKDSTIVRMSTGYSLKASREGGPVQDTGPYPMGTFVDDYEWIPNVLTGKTRLDRNNGRFCVTPEYPQGVYAYYITIDKDNNSVFPHIVGNNFYSVPVASNYEYNVKQDSIPPESKRLFIEGTDNNGENEVAIIENVSEGSVSSVTAEDSQPIYGVGSKIYVDDTNSGGEGASGVVSSTYGKPVKSIESVEVKASILTSVTPLYSFAGDIITQASTGASGELLRDTTEETSFVIRNVQGKFESETDISTSGISVSNKLITSGSNVVNLLLSQDSTYSKDATISLVEKANTDNIFATGKVLISTTNQNSVRILVESGDFNDHLNYSVGETILKSSDISNTAATEISFVKQLSKDIVIIGSQDNIAILETDGNHSMGEGDVVNIEIDPDATTTESTYWVRRKKFQELDLIPVNYNGKLNDTGIGSSSLIGYGSGYDAGTYTDIELEFSSYTESRSDVVKAKVKIVIGDTNNISSLEITDAGSGYRKDDILTITDASVTKITGAPNPMIPLLVVNSIGLGKERTDAVLDTVYSLSNGDILKINNELVKILSIDQNTRKVSFERGYNNTDIVNHSLGVPVTFNDPQYNFTFNDKIFGTGANDPRVISYNTETHKLLIAFDFVNEGATNPLRITDVSTFEDHSTPAKLVSISRAFDKVEKLQFSPDNTNFETNPVLQIQKYYFYKFDTSHPSMLGSYLDISTSPNYNIFTEEKEVSLIEPGNTGSNIRIRLGYGPNIGDIKRKAVNFISYYYFLTTEDIDTGGSYLSVNEDPLAGNKTITYTTPDKFVYNLDSVPQYDGTGDMRYTGKSIGKIATVTLDNLGFGYKTLPIIKGVVPANDNKAQINAIRNIVTGKITELSLLNGGSGYVNPEAIVFGDGSGLTIDLLVKNGAIVKAEISNGGSDYTYTPLIEVIETSNKLYFESEEIGKPDSVRFVRYGSNYHNDKSILPSFNSPSTFVLSGFDDDAFEYGEIVEQKVNNVVVASGVVSKTGWKKGINILRLEKIDGVFREGYPITNRQRGGTATIVSIKKSSFKPVITTRESRIGKFTSDRGKVSSLNQRITDSNFYQDYSYVIRSRTPIDKWRNALKDTTHPAGFKMFGEVYVESEGSNRMNPVQQNIQNVTTYLCIPTPKITSSSVTRTITETIIGSANINVRRGLGSVSVDAFDETMTRVREITLSPAFDGVFDSDTGQSVGTQEFTIIDKATGSAYTPYNEQELMISLDGIVQQPIRTYRVTGNQIKFYEAPLGQRTEEGVVVPSVLFYGKAFKFREDTNNARYLKRLKDISDQFDGRQKNFDLYYEDGSIVKTDLNENLLLYLDAILLQDTYTVRRFVSANKTDRLIFKKAPKNFADLYEGVPNSLQGEQYFHGHTVGSYERLHIDENVIPFSTSNSYLILDENNRVKTFDDPLYAYVFVNGVLQRHLESYRIVGPSIIFNRPLKYALQSDGSYTTAKVNILYFYGKDYEPTLTFFDHEQDVFYNRTTITIDGKYDEFSSWYGPNSSSPTSAYQIINGVKESWGYLIEVQKNAGTEWQLVMRSHNIEYIDGNKIFVTRGDGNDLELSVTSFNVSYNTNSSGERLLNRMESNIIPWLNTTDISDSYEYKGEIIKEHPSLKKGDMIKIDGEFDWREVTSTPLIAKSKQYNDGESVSNSFFAKVKATEYNGDVYGEGFTVTAAVKDGVINTLSWNKRDLDLFFKNNILLNPTAYNYYTPPVINFIPVDGKGGGAKAEVLVHGGQILDIVLIDGGSGYEKAPRCVISRGYDIVRKNDTFESSVEIVINGLAGANIAGASSEDYLWKHEVLNHEVSLVSPMISLLVTLHRWHMPVRNTTFQAHEQFITKIITPQPPEPKTMSSSGSTASRLELRPNLDTSYITYQNQSTMHQQTGVVDMLEQPVENGDSFTQGKLGTTVATFMEYLFMDHGEFNVSGINIEQFEIFYPFLAINQNPNNWMENYTIDYSSVTSSGVLFNPGIPSIHDRGGNLDQAFNIGDTFLYITGSTANFPSSGKLLVGKEVIEYDGTVNFDRFVITARGVNGTTEEDHLAGDYFRTLGKYN